MTIEEMKELLEKALPAKRFKHSVAVYETALKLAAEHNLPTDKIAISALLHDCGREIPKKESVAKAEAYGIQLLEVEIKQPILLHAILGAPIAKEKYGVDDVEILDGIRYHTTGKANMSPLAMVVFLADMIEPGRDFPGVEELRQLAKKSLEEAMLKAYSNTINYLLEEKLLIHPDCIAGYNQLMLKKLK